MARTTIKKPSRARSKQHEQTDLQGPPDQRFVSRDLSWLEFNRRVLHEAVDTRTPLLERVFFLSIFTSNLDEFFMKRVGMLKRLVEDGVVTPRADGMTAAQQLSEIRKALLPMLQLQAGTFKDVIRPDLAQNGIKILDWSELAGDDRKAADGYFHASVFPVLTPLAVDPGHPFPFISNLSTSLAVILRHPDKQEQLFARVKIPKVLPQFVQLPNPPAGGDLRFIDLIDLIRNNLSGLFPDMTILNATPFRITRNADVERDEDDAEDLLGMVEEELRQRRFEKVIRLEHGPNPDPWVLKYLVRELDLPDQDVYEMPTLLDFTSLKQIADLAAPKLKNEPWVPITPKALADESADIFAIIRKGDLLVHHPYESFTGSVERFVKAAVNDPAVLAIKITLYRTGDDSPFIPLLIRAAEEGKQVVCLIELKARFDEERNIYLAQALEKAGVHVVYGIVGLKTHTKTTLVVRQEPDGMRCYAHIGTGNYHVQTAKLYTDLSLLTCRKELADELIELFHYLTGISLKKKYDKLLVAPVTMKDRFIGMIEREIANKKAGRPAHIVGKMNSLEDHDICLALCRAGQAGVPVDLIIRGFCCLRPGVPGLTENVRVISVIGRFLEHSRIFYFLAGCEDPLEGEFYIGSADWMSRNLMDRVEVITPVESRPQRETLWQIIQIMLADQRQAWDMKPDGTYVQRTPADPSAPAAIGTHRTLMELAKKSAAR
ncbi:MAG: polyphosphate kinase 1 [Planctomycetes bacterium]|nr:polyphosphate kinase 1 [Planctomycetota bacterium]